MLHWVSIFNYIFFFIVVKHTIAYVNHSLGFEFCSTHGGMYSHNSFKHNNGFAYIKDVLNENEQLLEGESAWIDGFVEYTTFVSFESCYQATQSLTAVEIPLTKGINIYLCINACRKKIKTLNYIGLKSNSCLCLDVLTNFTRMRTENYNCDQFEPHNLKFISTSSDQFPVFNVIVTRNFQWDPPSTGSKQCVNAKKTGNQDIYATDSCYKASADGFLCSQIQSKNISKSFCIVASDVNVCIVTDRTSWLQAKQKCTSYTGSLDRQIFSHHQNHLNSTKKYWVGMFRSFDIVSNSNGRVHSTACLAVTRVGDKLMLDPDDCKERKRLLCADGLYGDIHEDENIDTTHLFTPTTNSNFATSRDSNESGQYVAIFVSTGVILIAIVSIVLYFVCRKQSRDSTRQRLSSSYNASCGQGHGNGIDVSGTAVQMLNGSEKTDKGPIPSKPSRRTIRQSSKHSNYENIKMEYGKRTRKAEQCNDNQDYERVNLKGIKANVSNKTQPETCEATIYDHTFQTDEQENYDTCTLKSSKS